VTQARIWAVVLVVAALFVLVALVDTGNGPNSVLEEKAERATALKDGRGVRTSTATLLAGGFAVLGTLLGVGRGLFGDRYLRHRGDILCRSSDWRMTCTLRDLWESEKVYQVPFDRTIPANERLMARAEYGNYACSVKLFNETEAATGLRDITVVFLDDSGTVVKTDVPQIVDSRNFVIDPDVINLPARQWINAKYHGRIGPEEFEALVRRTTVEMRAYLPGDKSFVRQITRLWE